MTPISISALKQLLDSYKAIDCATIFVEKAAKSPRTLLVKIAHKEDPEVNVNEKFTFDYHDGEVTAFISGKEAFAADKVKKILEESFAVVNQLKQAEIAADEILALYSP